MGANFSRPVRSGAVEPTGLSRNAARWLPGRDNLAETADGGRPQLESLMTDLLLSHGSYLGIILFMILTGAGLPLPEEVAIVAAGVLASVGRLDPWLALGACLFGALVGDCIMYWIGRHFGRRVLREHHWWNRFVKPEREAQVEQMLRDHGFKVLFLSRFLVGLRSPVYLSAGILRLPFRRFLLYDLFCATVVIGTFFGLSYYFGEAIYRWIRGFEYGATAIAVVVIVSIVVYFWRRRVRRLAEEALLAAASATASIGSADGPEPAEKADRAGRSASAASTDARADRTPVATNADKNTMVITPVASPGRR